ncbi:hypothetical protein ACFJIX_03485 [Roseateles sp. UC29_93]|uniref:hypothetical protein n=1 Tax=Roseateles sp. UC29_93 TaxID=3350177 RepID=UPI003672364B
MNSSALSPPRLTLVMLIAAHPIAAHAHGDAQLLTFVMAAGMVAGMLSGCLAALVRRISRVPWPLWFLVYLAIGALAAALAVQDIGGATLFLAFGGLGGVLPFVAAFYLVKAVCDATCRRLKARSRARRDSRA